MLKFFSYIFEFIGHIKNILYDQLIVTPHVLPVSVISVGNLSMGGAGKTPIVEHLIKHLLSRNKKIAVLSRGYGRQSKSVQILNKNTPKPALFFGDEAFMLYSKYDISYAVGASRFTAGKALLKSENFDYFILDDGFQHRQLFRNLDIVLLDVSQNKSFYQTLPSGRLREGFKSLQRADIILFTKVNLVSKEILLDFKKSVNDAVCLENTITCDVGYFLSQILSDGIKKIDKDKPVVLLSGIAAPGVFEEYILEKNFSVKKHFIYKDHFVFSEQEVKKVVNYCVENNITQVICTEKDWHKLKEFLKLKSFLFYAELDLTILTNSDLFLSKVNAL